MIHALDGHNGRNGQKDRFRLYEVVKERKEYRRLVGGSCGIIKAIAHAKRRTIYETKTKIYEIFDTSDL